MKRLTFDGNFCDIAQCQETSCPYNGSCSQKQVGERLKQYEDLGRTPESIVGMNAGAQSARRTIEQLESINELLFCAVERLISDSSSLLGDLCQLCGKYKNAHEGACDGCRWKQ